MWSFLANLAISFLGFYAKSPMAKQIVSTVVNDLKEEGQRVLPIAVDTMKEIACDNNLSGKGKFDYVLNKTLSEAQTSGVNLGSKVTVSLLNLAYRALQTDPSVSEIE